MPGSRQEADEVAGAKNMAVAIGQFAFQDDEFLDTGTIARGWSLTIDWDDSAPRVGFLPTLMDGRLQMVLKSQAGRTHIIEASTDLQSWFPLSTNTMIGTNMSIVFPDAHVHPHRFFRVIRCPNIDLSR